MKKAENSGNSPLFGGKLNDDNIRGGDKPNPLENLLEGKNEGQNGIDAPSLLANLLASVNIGEIKQPKSNIIDGSDLLAKLKVGLQKSVKDII